jgi:RNA polymerase sigma factor (sigma-70 family)
MEDITIAPPRRRLGRRRPDTQQLVVETISRHADALLRTARRHTACQADAEDAYQRALEIFVKCAHRLDSASAHKWLHTVVKHEAYAVREQRARYVGVDEETALDALDDGRHVASVEERSERFDELTRAAEALGRLKPQEVTALWLKAQGLSYREIAERQGWTYTKVNRCLTEGRKSFLERFADIRSGAECERWLPVLSAVADGEAGAEQLVEVRPHLRNCPGCRAVLAGMRASGTPVAALLPAGLLVGGSGGGLLDRLGELVVGVQERIVAPLVKAQSAVEATSASKVAAVAAASAAALAGGGVAVHERVGGGDAARAAERPSVVEERRASAGPASAPASAAPLPAPSAVTLPAPDPSGAAVAASAPTPVPREAPKRETREAQAPPPEPEGAEFAAETPAAPAPEPSPEPSPFDPVEAPAPAAPAPAPAPSPAPAPAPSPAPSGDGESSPEFGF